MGIALCSSAVAFAFLLLLLVQVVLFTSASHIDEDHGEHKSAPGMRDEGMMEKLDFEKQMKLLHKRPVTLQVAGSSLPDCSHACGSCTPCRLVKVSFVCSSSLEEAETCPMAYKCVCNSKSYPVP